MTRDARTGDRVHWAGDDGKRHEGTLAAFGRELSLVLEDETDAHAIVPTKGLRRYFSPAEEFKGFAEEWKAAIAPIEGLLERLETRAQQAHPASATQAIEYLRIARELLLELVPLARLLASVPAAQRPTAERIAATLERLTRELEEV